MNGYSVRKIDWQSPDSEAARAVRLRVFVEEQKVPLELEIDEIDLIAQHVIACDAAGRCVGTGRLFPDAEEAGAAHIGRMAVVPEARGTGAGAALLTALVEEARRQGFREVTLSAQVHALGFYERQGFEAFGEVYDDAGIPHRGMRMGL